MEQYNLLSLLSGPHKWNKTLLYCSFIAAVWIALFCNKRDFTLLSWASFIADVQQRNLQYDIFSCTTALL